MLALAAADLKSSVYTIFQVCSVSYGQVNIAGARSGASGPHSERTTAPICPGDRRSHFTGSIH